MRARGRVRKADRSGAGTHLARRWPDRLARAAGVAERRPPVTAAERLTTDPVRGRERLSRWRTREPFQDQRWWRARLAEQDIDEPALAALLGEPDRALANRLGRPQWAARLLTDLSTQPDPSPPAGGEDGTFLPLVAPLLAAANRRLRDRLAPVVAAVEATLGTPQALVDQLYPSLPAYVDRLLHRAMVGELQRARASGSLRGADSQARFADFIAGLGQPPRRRELLGRYPVLARSVTTAIDQWEQTSHAFATRLAADLPALADRFAGGGELGRLVAVDGPLGDRHRGGATVLSVRFSTGVRIVYKPRPVRVDVHFQQLLDWLNHRVELPLRTLAYLDRGDYGWVEFAAAEPCRDAAMIRRFYRRQGMLLALLSTLCANDVHSGNLVAAGEHPVLVDLETVLAPSLPHQAGELTGAERRVLDVTSASVLGVGLLPGRIWATEQQAGTDLSGLAGAPAAAAPLPIPTVSGRGTDTMRVGLAARELGSTGHRPVEGDTPLRLLDYTDDILAGFTETYRALWRHRDELVGQGGAVTAFAGDEVRAVLRPTMWYALVLESGTHPEVVGDGLDAERHLDLLWRPVPESPAVAAAVPAERRDLWQGDVPLFTARTDRGELYDSRGAVVAGIRVRPGLPRARATLAAMSDGDLRRQQWLIRASLTTTALGHDTRQELPSYHHRPAASPLSRDQLIEAADALAGRLSRLAFQSRDSAQWMGVSYREPAGWSVGPLLPDLYHGLTGLALFLGWCGELTGDPAHSRLARRTVRTAIAQLERGALDRTVGMAGLPGAIYALTWLGLMWGEEQPLTVADSLLDRLGDAVETDQNYDVVGGAAGTILALRTVHRLRPADPIAAVIGQSADRLVDQARHFPEGAGWLPAQLLRSGQADRPIAGFAHGVGSIGWALLEAAELLGEPRYRELGEAAVRYEQALFDPDLGGWADRRDRQALGIPDGEPPPVAWCYGAMGIGIGRLRALRHLPDDPLCPAEIDAALAATRRGGFGHSHCLCHGDIGNCEIFLHAAEVLGQPRMRAEAAVRIAGPVAHARRHGWICGTPHGVETPGLLVGLAGAGYGLLRVAAPDRVPAVLALL